MDNIDLTFLSHPYQFNQGTQVIDGGHTDETLPEQQLAGSQIAAPSIQDPYALPQFDPFAPDSNYTYALGQEQLTSTSFLEHHAPHEPQTGLDLGHLELATLQNNGGFPGHSYAPQTVDESSAVAYDLYSQANATLPLALVPAHATNLSRLDSALESSPALLQDLGAGENETQMVPSQPVQQARTVQDSDLASEITSSQVAGLWTQPQAHHTNYYTNIVSPMFFNANTQMIESTPVHGHSMCDPLVHSMTIPMVEGTTQDSYYFPWSQTFGESQDGYIGHGWNQTLLGTNVSQWPRPQRDQPLLGFEPQTALADHGRVYSPQDASGAQKGTACWDCRILHEPCNGGDPCDRCLKNMNSTRLGRSLLNGCVRQDLVDLYTQFISAGLINRFSRDGVERSKSARFREWVHGLKKIKVALTVHCGDRLEVTMREFEPMSEHMSHHVQIRDTEVVIRRVLPLAFMDMAEIRRDRLYEYIESFFNKKNIDKFVEKCYEAEGINGTFQRGILELIRELYEASSHDRNQDMHQILKLIMRMLAVTWVMNTIVGLHNDCRDDILAQLHNCGDASEYDKHSSPLLGVLQIKSRLEDIRCVLYSTALSRLATLTGASKRHRANWFNAFCLILALAMVLEECQHLHHIRAVAHVERYQRPRHQTHKQEKEDCEVIDSRFAFLVRLFHTKFHQARKTHYADMEYLLKAHKVGRKEEKFLRKLRNHAASAGPFLQSVAMKPIAHEHDAFYTGRLVVHFLDVFMNLGHGTEAWLEDPVGCSPRDRPSVETESSADEANSRRKRARR